MKHILMALIALNFIGCTQFQSQSPESGAAQTGEAGKGSVRGTGDSTGGNGLTGGLFERNIRDITKTPEWQPIAQLKERFGESRYSNLFTHLARARTWYFIDSPDGLAGIPKERLGVGFIRDRIYQYAIQTDREVWVDLNLFNAQVPPAERSKEMLRLYLHELSVVLYQFRFLSFEGICRLVEEKDETCKVIRSVVPRLFLAFEPPRPLIESDYAKIRAMTAWLMENLETLTGDDFTNSLRRFEFDQRLWVGDIEPRVEMSAEAIGDVLMSAQNLGRMPTHCGDAQTTDLVDRCTVKFTFTPPRSLQVSIRREQAVETTELSFSLESSPRVGVFPELFNAIAETPDARHIQLAETKSTHDVVVGTPIHVLEIGFYDKADFVHGGPRVVGVLLSKSRVYRTESNAGQLYSRPQEQLARSYAYAVPDGLGHQLFVYTRARASATPIASAAEGMVGSLGYPEPSAH